MQAILLSEGNTLSMDELWRLAYWYIREPSIRI